jgi:pSer/pThr/pTyr-binding forkhead associated (FHA) protein
MRSRAWSTRRSLRRPRRALVVLNGRDIALGEGDHVIGCDAGAAIAVTTSSASRRHARIRIRGLEAMLDDLGSNNGTYLDGRPVTAPTPLADGNRIRIGLCELTFRTLAGQAATQTLG